MRVGVNIWAGFFSIWASDFMFVGSNFGFNDEAQNLVALYHIHFVNEKVIILYLQKKEGYILYNKVKITQKKKIK